MRWVLAIDDSPRRYTRLMEKFQGSVGVIISYDPEAVDFYLTRSPYRFCGVLLDHDMPIENGKWFAEKYLIDKNIPVVITSHNPGAAVSLEHFLVEWGVPTLRSPVPQVQSDDCWVHQVANHFGIEMKPNIEDGLKELKLLQDRLLEKCPAEFAALSNAIARIQGYELPDEVLKAYKCEGCGTTGIKLWRPYGSSYVRKTCAKCATAGTKISRVDEDGLVEYEPGRRTDQLYDPTSNLFTLIPCVPDKNGHFWGYTSIPQAGVLWWRQLPTYKESK